MNNIILCEGFDDAYILGYFLYKTGNWVRTSNPNFPKTYTFPKINTRNQSIEYYNKDDKKLAIWSVGGKDSYDKAFKFVNRVNKEYPDMGISNLFIVSDRDDLSIEQQLESIASKLKEYNINISNLQNNTLNTIDFEVEKRKYSFNIIPIIIPFDVEGALETILMRAIEEDSEENEFVVNKACEYVESIKNNPIITSYLQKSRLILKAKFSSTVSITNPDRSTTIFNNLLTAYDWEKAESIQGHFGILNTYL